MNMNAILKQLNIKDYNFGACVGGDQWLETESQGEIISFNPSNNKKIANVYKCSDSDYEKVVKLSSNAFEDWRKVPAPVRGQLIFEMGNAL